MALPLQVIQAKDIDGLLPALDVRQPGKHFVLEGRNFKWTVQGPESGFGSRYISSQCLDDVSLSETFRVDDRVLYAGNNAFYSYDTISQTYYPIYFFTDTPALYPWSFTQLLTKYYFARKGLGLFEYNPATESIRKITNISLPANPVAVTTIRQRLVVLGTSTYAWSAIEDPDTWTPSLATGAGFQALSLVGGDAYAVKPSTDGFVVYTSKGLISAEYADNQAVFRHEVLTRFYKPINPFCIKEIDEGVTVFCDRKGLFRTNGQLPEPFVPLFGQFLTQTLLPQRDLTSTCAFRIHIAQDQQLMFFMVSLPGQEDLYEQSWCLHIPTEKFGSFDKLHYGFGEFNLGINTLFDFNFGYIDGDGFVHRFTGEAFNENTTRPDDGYYYHSDFDMPARIEDGTIYAPSMMQMSAEEEWYYAGLESGIYTISESFTSTEFQTMPDEQSSELDGGTYLARADLVMDAQISQMSASLYPLQAAPLDAYILLGTFRFSEMRRDNELGEVLQLSVHNGPLAAQEEDWLESSGEEDMVTSTMPDEDWGVGVESGDLYIATLIGTNDGYTTFQNHENVLINIAPDTEKVKRFPGAATKGLFHLLRIEASEVSHTFHIKLVELDGFGAGFIN